MNDRMPGLGLGLPIIGGAYLLISNISESTLFSEGRLTSHAARSAFGLFLLILGLVFLYRNLK